MTETGSATKRRIVKYLGAVVFAACALWMIGLSFRLVGSGNKPTGFWYLDMNTGKLFLGDTQELPPIVAPSGGPGMRAHIYGCEKGCGNVDLEDKSIEDLTDLGLFMTHVERISDEGLVLAKQAQTNTTGKMTPETAAYLATMDHHLIMFMNSSVAKWIKPTAETTRMITEMSQNRCGGSQAEPCIPGRK